MIALVAGAVALMATSGAEAQNVAQKVAAVQNGTVRMSFAAKPGVCGYRNGISRGGNNRMNWSSEESPDVVYDQECSHSPVRVVLQVADGRVTRLRSYVGGEWRPGSSATDLGTLPVKTATDYLLSLANTGRGSAATEAILPATLADSVTIWPELFRIARNTERPMGTRKQALFWLGQAAGDVVAPDPSRGGHDSDEDEVRKSAVFALSQQRNGEAVPALIQVARTNKSPAVRRNALFWLGQTTDPRAISLFEEILR
jgi:hypothetical protein